MLMKVQLFDRAGALIVRPQGELTEDAARAVHVEIERETGEARDVILDLSEVERVAVGALPVLFRIQQQTRRGDHTFYVAGARDSTRRLFEMTRVTENLRLVNSAEEALAVRT